MIFVSDNADILVAAREQPHQFLLCRIGILKFIHLNVAEPFVPFGSRVRMLPKYACREEKQIVEINGAGAAQDALVRLKYRSGSARSGVVSLPGHLSRSDAMIFRVANALPKASRSVFAVVQLQFRERELDGANLRVIVVNCVIAGKPDSCGFAPQEPGGERMKRGNQNVRSIEASCTQQIGDALLHLLGSFIRKCDAEN